MAVQRYYAQQGQRKKTVPDDQLKLLATSGTLKPDDLVWKKGMASWGPASEVDGLFPDEPPPLPSELPPLVPTNAGASHTIPQDTLERVPLSAMQLRILRFLAEKQDWATREEISAKTGDKKGFSKALGAPTNPPIKPDSLEGRGLVERRGTTQPFQYRITPAGQRALCRGRTGTTTPRPSVDAPRNTSSQAPPQVAPPNKPPVESGSTPRQFAKNFAHLRLDGYRNINELTRPEHQLHGCETLFGDFYARVMVLLQDFANVPIVKERVQRGEPNPFHHDPMSDTNRELSRLFSPYFKIDINGGERARTCGLYYANAIWLVKECPKSEGKSAAPPKKSTALQVCEPVFHATLQNLPNLELIIAFGKVAFEALQKYLHVTGDWENMVVCREVCRAGKYLIGTTCHPTLRGVKRRKKMSPNDPDPMAGDIRAFMQAIEISTR
jgi:hypothetical protein